MRGIIFFLLALFFSHAQEIQISQKLKTLILTLPTQKHYTTNSKETFLQIIVDDKLVQQEQVRSLSTPFEKIQITPLSSAQTQITIFGKNLSLKQGTNNQGIHLEIYSEVLKISWLSYFYVCLLLGALILVLFWLKRRLNSPTKPANYKETPLSTKSKIISFEYDGVQYQIFSNEKGNILLNHYPKEHHNKDFTHLISED